MRPRIALPTLVVAGLLLFPSASFAAFTRPFLRQIARAENPSGLSCSAETTRAASCFHFGGGGIALDSAGNLWVGNGDDALSEFSPSGEFLAPTVTLEKTLDERGQKVVSSPESLSIENSTGNVYITGDSPGSDQGFVEIFNPTGMLCKRWGLFQGAHVAVDNSLAPFAGSLYVSHGDEDPSPPFGDGLPRGVEKFEVNGLCEPTQAPFGFSASYIVGGQIVGSPDGKFESAGSSPGAVTVDSHGNIYVSATIQPEGQFAAYDEVSEYEASGRFVRAFTGGETPGLGESHQNGGWGGYLPLGGVAVDPVSGDVLPVRTVNNNGGEEGAVDEFDSVGHFLKQITETELEVSPGVRKPGRLHNPVEMTIDPNGDLYVADMSASNITNGIREGAVDVYGPGRLLAGVRIAEAGERQRESAVLHGSVDPEGVGLADCHFEFVPQAQFEASGFEGVTVGEMAACVPSASSVSVDKNWHPVEAALSGLTSGATYDYRLVATTEGALGGTEASGSSAFTALDAPRIDSASARNVSSSFVDLHGLIAPHGATTTYHFEYDTTPYTAGGAGHGVSVPIPGVDVGSGGATGAMDVSVVQHVGGLSPGTTYYFRLVAENELGVAEGIGGATAQGTFTALSSSPPGLPDGRAYELVTPVNKGSASDMFVVQNEADHRYQSVDYGYPSESGDEFMLEAGPAAFGPYPNSALTSNPYVFSRAAPATSGYGGGWSYSSLAVPSLGVQQANEPLFDPADLSRIVFGDALGTTVSEGGQHEKIFRGGPGGPYTELYSAPEGSGETVAVTVAAASHDLNHVILESDSHTLAGGALEQDKGSQAVYEWEPVGTGECTESSSVFSEGAHGCTSLVNVNDEGTVINRCGALLGEDMSEGRAYHAVSGDGSRVLFTAPDPLLRFDPSTKETRQATQECWNGEGRDTPQLYMRVDGQTLEVSAPEAGVSDPTGSHPAVYVGASEDDSKVFFFTTAELTADAVALKLHDPELYECEVIEEAGTPRCVLTRVSAGEPGSAGADIFTVPAISADGSAVYFTAFGKLAAGAATLSENTGGAGPVNLYRYDTVTHTIVFVATVDQLNYPTTLIDRWWGSPDGNFALSPEADWYTTPNGRYLLFSTDRELTGYDTSEADTGACPPLRQAGAGSDGHCAEIYRYRYEPGSPSNGSIVCVSCDPSGALPLSNAFFASLVERHGVSAPPLRAISDDGSYAFFDSPDPLVAGDTNNVLDVYEWEARGRGGCALTGGCVYLISSGTDPAGSYFLGMTPDASNVFFGTHARLVPQDIDTYGDVYDARTCAPEAGDPCIKPVVGEAGACEGDACHRIPPSPIDATPNSLTFSGAGNPTGAETKIAPKQRPLTNAQRLAIALKACRGKPKRTRDRCQASARKRYGTRAKRAKREVRAAHPGHQQRAGR